MMKRPRPALGLSGAFSDFSTTIDKLRCHLEIHRSFDRIMSGSIDLQNPPIFNSDHPHGEDLRAALEGLHRSRVDEKRLLYSTMLLIMFGTFETFLEQLAHEYLERIGRLVKYRDLPISILEAHITGTASIILARNKSRYRSQYRDWKVNTLIRQLNGCLVGEEPYDLNLDAFTYRTSNFRVDLVRDLFVNLGIADVLKKMTRKKCLRSLLLEKYAEHEIETIPAKDLFAEIDSLAERRNEVAHGPLPEDIVSIDTLESTIGFICSFAQALNGVCGDELLAMDLRLNGTALPAPIARPASKVVCFRFADDQGIELGSGDPVIAVKKDGTRKLLRVVKLEVMNEKVGRIEWSKDTAVGIEMDGNVKQDWSYHVIV